MPIPLLHGSVQVSMEDTLMGVQDFLTAALFKRDDAGRTVVFPNGFMGRGYIVPDTATEQRMRRTMMWLIISAGAVGGVGSQLLSIFFGPPLEWTAGAWAIALGALVLVSVAYRIIAAGVVRGLAPAGQKLALIEALAMQVRAMPRWYLWLIAVLGPLMLIGSLHWLLSGGSFASGALGLLGVMLFGMVTAQAIYGLTRQQQQQ